MERAGCAPPQKSRVAWIAEDVSGVAPPDYKIDEATTVVTEPNSHGIFTLSRPESGWAEGKYRVEFYLDQTFVDAVKVGNRQVRLTSPPSLDPFSGIENPGLYDGIG